MASSGASRHCERHFAVTTDTPDVKTALKQVVDEKKGLEYPHGVPERFSQELPHGWRFSPHGHLEHRGIASHDEAAAPLSYTESVFSQSAATFSSHGKPASSEGTRSAVLRRIGLSMLAQGEDFQERSRAQAKDAESKLQALRQQTQVQTARCLLELEEVAKEAFAEAARQHVSALVSQELIQLRSKDQRCLKAGQSGDVNTATPWQQAQSGQALASVSNFLDRAGTVDTEESDLELTRRLRAQEAKARRTQKLVHHSLQCTPRFHGSLKSRSEKGSEAQQLLDLNWGRLDRLGHFGR